MKSGDIGYRVMDTVKTLATCHFYLLPVTHPEVFTKWHSA